MSIRFEVGKWYRFVGGIQKSWRGRQNDTTVRNRVVDKKPRLCTAVNETGDWCLFRSLPPNVNHPQGLWDWTDGIEHWQEVLVTVANDMVVYNCPVCGKPPKISTEVMYTKKYRSSDTHSNTMHTYRCCDFTVSGLYPRVLDSWNFFVGDYLENEHIIVETHSILQKVLKETRKCPKEIYTLRDSLNKFLKKRYGVRNG